MMLRLGAAILCILIAGRAVGEPRKPRLPPGLDPGGLAIAVLGTGLDYSRPEIAKLLARDGEGDLIGWDFVAGDNRPYAPSPNDTPAAWGGDGTTLARQIADIGRVRLIPIRIAPARPETLAQAVAFTARTPARLLLVPIVGDQGQTLEMLGQVAGRFPQILIVATVGTAMAPNPAASNIPNLLLIGNGVQPLADIAVEEPVPQPATADGPATLFGRLLTSLPACAAAANAGRRFANQKLMRLIELASQAEPRPGGNRSAGHAVCRIAALGP